MEQTRAEEEGVEESKRCDVEKEKGKSKTEKAQRERFLKPNGETTRLGGSCRFGTTRSLSSERWLALLAHPEELARSREAGE